MGCLHKLAVYPSEATNVFFVTFPFKGFDLLVASCTTRYFLRLVFEHGTGVYKYPQVLFTLPEQWWG